VTDLSYVQFLANRILLSAGDIYQQVTHQGHTKSCQDDRTIKLAEPQLYNGPTLGHTKWTVKTDYRRQPTKNKCFL